MGTSYDPETLHGSHYEVADFDNAVTQKAEAWIAEAQGRGEVIDQADRMNIYTEYRKQLYREWNRCDLDQVVRFEMANSMKYMGFQTSGFARVDDDNPLLQPVHGISLKDYAAMVIQITQGIPEDVVLNAMGIDGVVWDELNSIWSQRMAEDNTYTLPVLYGQFFAEGVTHPKLEALQPDVSAAGDANLERLKSDRYFYEELSAARTAAYQYGLDGAQWILDHYGINLADFQSVAMQHMTARNQHWNAAEETQFTNYMQEKLKEYTARFAAEQGGNIADDVAF